MYLYNLEREFHYITFINIEYQGLLSDLSEYTCYLMFIRQWSWWRTTFCFNNSVFRRIWQHYHNVQEFFFRKRDEDVMKKLKIWFDQQNSWTRSMIAKNKNDPLWRHVGLIMAQFDGLVAGYKSIAKQVYCSPGNMEIIQDLYFI